MSRCAHCKSLEPVISEVGKHYFEDPYFVVYRIDGSKNDVVHRGVRLVGYPTLYFFPGADKQSPMEYDGERTVEAIVEFIQAFRTHYSSSESSTSGNDGAPIGGAEAAENAEDVGREEGQDRMKEPSSSADSNDQNDEHSVPNSVEVEPQ